MKEKLKGLLAGLIFRMIALVTLGQISPILGTGIIVEQDDKILLLKRSDGLGYAIPGGIVRYKETIEQSVLREAREETGYAVAITGLVGIYSDLQRDPRLRGVAITYKGTIVGGAARDSAEGTLCWCKPEEVYGRLAFDHEDMLKDYLSGQLRLS